MRRLFTAAFVVFALVSSASAEDEPDVDCDNPIAQMEMNYCAGLEFEEADAELNAVWKDALAAARDSDTELKEMGDDGRPGYEETLKKAQRAWIGFRDEWCLYIGYEARGGSMEPMLISGCMADLTRKRTQELKDSLEGLGN